MRHNVLILAATLDACVGPPAPPAGPQTGEFAGWQAEAPKSCVTTFGGQNLRVIDSSTLAYGYGRTIYVNRLGRPCPGITELSTLIIDAQAGEYCRGDRVRGIEPGAIIAGPSCVLGDWLPYRSR